MNKIRFKSLILGMVLILVLGTLVACTNNDPEPINEEPSVSDEKNAKLEITDDFGTKVVLENKPEKIVSLAPNNTEILFALGLGDKVVGVTSFCDYPPEALDVENVGDFSGNNLERIIELEPDLVITYGVGNEDENARLREAGINVIGFEPESIDEVIDTISRIGKITGTDESAKSITEDMHRAKDEIVSKVVDVDKPKVFYEVWHEPIMTAGPGSFMDHLITLAGGENIASDAADEYPQFDLEQLVERNPEVYLTTADLPEKTVESIMERPGYADIDAINQGRVHLLDPNIVSRPGPRIVEALELVAKTIHPEIFE